MATTSPPIQLNFSRRDGTRQDGAVIALLAILKERKVNGRALIVVPSSTMENWVREFQRWCPALTVLAYRGCQAERAEMRNVFYNNGSKRFKNDVLLTTYTMLGTTDDRRFLRKCNFVYMILDEGHLIKNIASQRYKNLMQIETQYRVLLTGTPL